MQQSAILRDLMGCILAGIRPEFGRNWMEADNVATILARRSDMLGAAFAIVAAGAPLGDHESKKRGSEASRWGAVAVRVRYPF